MKRHLLIAGFAVLVTGPFARAQWTTQQIVLTPGWNAIHLELQPESADLDAVFAGIPIDSVWEWKGIQPSTQFLQDATNLLPKTPEWGTYFPPAHPQRFLRDLFHLKGGKPLLVNLNGAANATLNLIGKPSRPQNKWLPASFSLVGLPVASSGAPSFQAFFANSVGHVGSPVTPGAPSVYSLNPLGTWAPFGSFNVPQRGRAYWIKTLGPSTYDGPLQVEIESASGINFGAFRDQSEIAFINTNATGNRIVTLEYRPSEPRPATALDSPPVAGQVPMSYRDLSTITDRAPVAAWLPIAAPISLTLAPGERKVIQLAVRRGDLANPAPGSGPVYSYQGLLDVKSGGVQQTIGITAESDLTPSVAARTAKGANGNGAIVNRCGLWLGTVTVDHVSWAGEVSPTIRLADPAYKGPDRTVPVPTVDEFQFKVLFHMNSSGQVKLLQKVIQVFENGTYVPDPLNPGTVKPGTPGTYRFFSTEAGASQAGFTGAALRDGKFIARRWSTANFAIRQPVVCTGSFASGTLEAGVFTDYNHSLNPYRHKFHPQHDNQNALYSEAIAAGIESYDIKRELQFQFETVHPEGLVDLAYGTSVLGGTYLEKLKGGHYTAPNARPNNSKAVGPHSRDIFIKGKFLISRISDVDSLD